MTMENMKMTDFQLEAKVAGLDARVASLEAEAFTQGETIDTLLLVVEKLIEAVRLHETVLSGLITPGAKAPGG